MNAFTGSYMYMQRNVRKVDHLKLDKARRVSARSRKLPLTARRKLILKSLAYV